MKKKILSIIGCGALLISVAGCGDAKTKPNDGDDWLVKVNGENITNDQVYSELVSQGNIAPIQSEINVILTDKVFKTTKKDEEEANKQVANLKAQAGDKFKDYLAYVGVKNEKELKNNVILPSIKLKELPKKYFEEDYEDLSDEYELRELQVIYTNDKNNVKKLKKAVKEDNVDFNKLTKYGNKDAFNTDKAVYSNKFSNIPEDVWDEVVQLSNGEISDVIKTNNNGYMVIKMINNDPEKFKKDGVKYLEEVAQNQQNIANQTAEQNNDQPTDGELNGKAFKYFLRKYDFSVHDVDVYQALLKLSDRYKLD